MCIDEGDKTQITFKEWIEKWSTVINVITTVVVAWFAVAGWHQANNIHEQQDKSDYIVNRAYLSLASEGIIVAPAGDNNDINITINLLNSGNTPAYCVSNIRARYDDKLQAMKPIKDLYQYATGATTTGIFGPKVSRSLSVDIPKNEISKAKSGSNKAKNEVETLHVWYTDYKGYEHKHFIEFAIIQRNDGGYDARATYEYESILESDDISRHTIDCKPDFDI